MSKFDSFKKKFSSNYIIIYTSLFILLSIFLTICCFGVFLNYEINSKNTLRQTNLSQQVEALEKKQYELDYEYKVLIDIIFDQDEYENFLLFNDTLNQSKPNQKEY